MLNLMGFIFFAAKAVKFSVWINCFSTYRIHVQPKVTFRCHFVGFLCYLVRSSSARTIGFYEWVSQRPVR